MFFANRLISLNISQFLKELQKIIFILLPFSIFTGPFFADLSISLIGIIFLFFLFKEKLYKKKNTAIIFFLLFWFFILISSFNSLFFRESIPSSFLYIRYLFFVLGGIYVINNNKKTLKLFSICLLFTYIIALTDGYIQYFFDRGITGIEYNKSRLSLPSSGELVMGSFLSRLFPLMLMFNLYFYKNNKHIIYIISIIFILVDVLIYLSGERAAFFYLLLSTLLILLMLDKYKLLRMSTFLISILIITFISVSDDSIKNRMFDQTIEDFQTNKVEKNNKDLNQKEIITQKNEDNRFTIFNKYYAFTEAHTALYGSALNIYIDNNFIFGTGPKTFRHHCKMNKYISIYGSDSCSTHPHNTYIQILTETGLVGLLSIFIFFLFVSFKIFKHIYFNIFKKKLLLNYIHIGSYVAIFITLWPFVPTGNYFNNWLSIIYFTPLIFIFSNKKFTNE